MNELDDLRTAAPRTVLTSIQAREELLAELHAMPAPSARASWRRRTILAGLSLAALGLSAGVATATGLMPSAFSDTYRDAFHNYPLAGQEGIDPDRASRVSTIPGPAGEAFSVLSAHGSDGYVCLTSVIEKLPLHEAGLPTSSLGQACAARQYRTLPRAPSDPAASALRGRKTQASSTRSPETLSGRNFERLKAESSR